MGSIRKTMAAMFSIIALAAFMSDADAQTRRSSDVKKSTTSRQSSGRQSSSQTRSSSSSSQVRRSSQQTRKSDGNNKSTTVRQSSQTRPAASRPTVTRPSSGTERKPSTTVTRPSSQTRPAEKPSSPSSGKTDFKPGNQDRPMQVTRPAPNPQRGNNPGNNRPSVRPDAGPKKPVNIRPDHRHDKPRVHPRDRDFMRWNKPSYYWSHHNHYYGYRVKILPSRAHRHIYHGRHYYCYNDVWYRPYGGYYVVCRPPYGISLTADIIADIAWTAVRLSYYNTVANTYNQINANNAYIAEQNAIIAQNNATIASQNSLIAQTQPMAYASYTLANSLGLVQSYASVDSEYFYQDGVFYSKDYSGEYRVILPPAGTLVETLPEDYDMVTLNDGQEYYKVDDTVYRVVVSDGKPYFEVLGQQYS